MDSTVSPNNRFDIIDFNQLSPETNWKRLGAGSFGSVWRADYLGLPVAVKEIFPRVDYNVEKYFARECKILQEARHPNIVQYIGLCLAPPGPPRPEHFHCDSDDEDDDDSHSIVDNEKNGKPTQRVLIISEFLPKGNLRTHILSHASSPALSWRLRLSFAIDITRAIVYLHQRRCLHRDLKLENCLITDNFRIKLCDFGFARLEPKNDEELRRLSYCGTDGYMSPEILRGDPFGLSTDVYSLGIIFCELITLKLTGQHDSSSPFLERLPPNYAIKPADMKVLLRSSVHGCPDGFLQLALKCSDVDSTQRPAIRTVLTSLDQIERQVVAAEAEMIAHAAKIEARAGPLVAKGLIDRLVKRDCVGSLSFGSGKTGAQIPDLRQSPKAEGVSEKDRPSSSRPKRIPSFDGQVLVPSSMPRSSKPKEDEGSEDSSSEDEDGEAVVEVACFPKKAKYADSGHPPPYHTESVIPQRRGSSTPSVASTIRQKIAPASKISTCPPSSNSLSSEEPGIRIPSTPPAYVSERADTQTGDLQVVACGLETHEMLLGAGLVTGNQVSSEETSSSSAAGNSGIPSNIGSIKTVLSDTSPTRILHVGSSRNEALTCPELTTSLLPVDVVEGGPASLPPSSQDAKETSNTDGALVFTNPTESIQAEPSIALALSEKNMDVLTSDGPRKSGIEVSRNANHQPLEIQGSAKPVVEGSPELTMEALLADSKPGEPELGPHRFTLFKPNWLTFLFLKSPSPGDPDYQRPNCGACEKKIGVRKTFLECDDCGMKCHNKCSDSPGLPNCFSNSAQKVQPRERN